MSSPTDGPAEPDEHHRYACHLQALANVDADDEPTLVNEILQDPDQVMAESAVARHIDDRARLLLTDERFPGWAHTMTGVIGERDFLTRRLTEWTLLATIAQDKPWAPAQVTEASDWFQRKAVEVLTSPDALALLAGQGRTRRVRATAERRQVRRLT
ncbi:hypothetical protein BJY14_001368 [Actinomadura luteofluorescens]|uniref:Uncharacterized protein n=1 Tax=Actinomadura luteofluorescens TaxID=46163 RepID=A0A7Y9JDY9_9ACTN|nr:hypothetical protein [Actinomadura luteofluorescens]NYD45385.1 hypothetical protein [Actinomadura luteofluorescens]